MALAALLFLPALAAAGEPVAAKATAASEEQPAATKAPAKSAEPKAKTKAEAEPAAEGETAETREEGTIRGRNLWETFSRGGPLMYPILACSLLGVAFAIERLISLRQKSVAPKDVAAQVLKAVGENGAAAGIKLCEDRPSALSRVLAAGLALAGNSREELNTAMQEAGERELWHLDRFAKPLSVIAGVAPLLGLLGTVWGMIMAFDVVAAKGALGDPRELAEGIAAALLTTFAGLSVAIPCYVLYHYFRSKSDRMIVEIEETASHLAARLEALQDAHPAPAGGGRGAAPDAAD
jgi:biopolymer transport protein ExbB